MHNSTKIKVPSQEDFYHVLGTIRESANEITEEATANEDRHMRQLIRERMDEFLKNMALIAANNVMIGDGEPINLNGLDQEPFDPLLEDEALELERQVRTAIENVVHQRESTLKELGPLAKEVINQRYLVNQEFEKEDPVDQEHDQSADIDTMLKEYQDAQRLLSQLEKTLPETKMNAEQLDEVLKCGKLL